MPVPSFPVGVAIGDWRKELRAVGARRWRRGMFGGWRATAPEPVDRVPLTWRLAWGGADDARNPLGIGRHAAPDAPLPQLEYADEPVPTLGGAHRPAGLGAIARSWSPRRERGGTYDEAWRRDRAPLPPDDLDPAWHQCAPDDQQLPLPDGPLACRLTGLTPDGERRFTLPAGTLPVDFLGADRHERRRAAHLDTIVIRPDLGDLLLTWRAVTRVRGGALGLRQIVVGELPESFFRARRLGKRWYRDSAALIAARRR